MPTFIEKLRALSEKKKLMIIIAVVVVFGLVLGFFWIKSAANSLSKLESVNLPKIELPTDTQNPQTPITNDQLNSNDQNSQVADWKTYTNAQYGFEFEYPVNWKYENKMEENVASTFFISPLTKDFPNDSLDSYIQFFVWPNPKNLSRNDLYSKAEQFSGSNPYKSSASIENKIIEGHDVSIFYKVDNGIDTKPNMFTLASILIDKNEIEFYANENNTKILQQMLSTFKFTNTTK